MPVSRKSAFAILWCGLLGATAGQAQRAKPQGFPDAPGKEVLLTKCFQCHAPTMWQDHRQDRRGWESVLYRMVGRGALWPPDGITTIADNPPAPIPTNQGTPPAKHQRSSTVPY